MMLETEYGAGQGALRVTQLLEALVRNCRYLCALGMHTPGMTVDGGHPLLYGQRLYGGSCRPGGRRCGAPLTRVT